MERYKYLIVGGGMTADAAVSGIREADTDWDHRLDLRGGKCSL